MQKTPRTCLIHGRLSLNLNFFYVYLFLRERQSARRGGAEREGGTESEAGSRHCAGLSAQSPMWDLNTSTVRS